MSLIAWPRLFVILPAIIAYRLGKNTSKLVALEIYRE